MMRNRNFVLLWLSQSISGAGDTFTFLALSIKINDFYTEAGDSARALSVVLIAFALPQLLLGVFAGTLVDRLDRRKVMIVSDILRGLIVPSFFFVGTAEQLPLAFIIALTISSFSVFFYPARTALLPSIVSEEELMTANGWMQSGLTLSRLAGPVLAGIVVGQWGLETAFIVDAVSYGVSAMLLFGIAGVDTRAALEELKGRTAWTDLKAGVTYALQSRLLQGVTLGISVAMLGIGAVNVLFVPFLRHVFEAPPAALGGVHTAQGVGMLVGGLLIGSLGKRLLPLRVAVGAILILGVSVVLFGFAPQYTAVLLIMPLAGLTLPPINASLQTILQRGVPRKLLGRAGAVVDMTTTVANLVSMGVAGWVADLMGLRETFYLSGALLLLGALAMGGLLRGEMAVPSEEDPQPELALALVDEPAIASD